MFRFRVRDQKKELSLNEQIEMLKDKCEAIKEEASASIGCLNEMNPVLYLRDARTDIEELKLRNQKILETLKISIEMVDKMEKNLPQEPICTI